MYKYVLLVIMPFAALLFSFPELILKILFGKEYIGAALLVQILAISSIIVVIAKINISIITGIGKPKLISKLMLLGAQTNLIANLILIPALGIIGGGISTILAFPIILAYSYKKLNKITKITIPIKKIFHILIASIGLITTAAILKVILILNVYLETAIILATSLLVYTAIVLLLKVTTIRENIGLLKKLVK